MMVLSEKKFFLDFLYSKVHKVYIRCIYMGTNLEVNKPKRLTQPNPRGCWQGNSWLLPCWDNDPRSCKACPEKQKSHERRFTYFRVIFECYYSIQVFPLFNIITDFEHAHIIYQTDFEFLKSYFIHLMNTSISLKYTHSQYWISRWYSMII